MASFRVSVHHFIVATGNSGVKSLKSSVYPFFFFFFFYLANVFLWLFLICQKKHSESQKHRFLSTCRVELHIIPFHQNQFPFWTIITEILQYATYYYTAESSFTVLQPSCTWADMLELQWVGRGEERNAGAS